MKHRRHSFQQSLQQWLRREIGLWRIGALPGLLIILIVVIARFTGNLQSFETNLLDLFLRLRPSEPIDPRILIVGIDEQDIQTIGTYPIPDGTLAGLLRTLQRHDPAVIGLDLFRDLPVEPGHAAWVETLKQTPSLIGIQKVLADAGNRPIAPPRGLSPQQVGFADAIPDEDGNVRRSLLGLTDRQGVYQFSFTSRLAEKYLATRGITLENGLRDPVAMRFDRTELTRFTPNAGGYVHADANGNQILINFRRGRNPFRIVSLTDVMADNVPDDWIRDRIVLVGVTALSAKDMIPSNALKGRNPSVVYGVEIQAHAVSQIVSAVLDHRPLLNVWADTWEYFWIIGWGLLGISLGRMLRSPFKVLLLLGMTTLLLLASSFALLMGGWWVPVAPALLVLVLNGAGLTASLFYQHEQDLKAKLHDRQLMIDQAFDAIHNGPLQTLARTLRNLQAENRTTDPIYAELKQLNQELRSVYESMRREALSQDSSLQVSSDLELNLENPLHESLYEVFSHTLSRDFPHFKQLRLTLPTFEAIDDRRLSLEQKRGICRFLEEALCNAGKYAQGMTRLEVVCKQAGDRNIIRVTDNGSSDLQHQDKWAIATGGRGTEQAKVLARQLSGRFQRFPNTPQGMICELSWPIRRSWFKPLHFSANPTE